ncbi:FAD binding domain-containing protein [Candidatus Bipolaricaulota bacterium]|nr:FAD binding domain-containing protein [Candidatus Bipolaricaulota bacterium]
MTNTHLLMHRFHYLQPATLKEAIGFLQEFGKDAETLAGGTNLLVWMKMEQRAPRCVINIANLPELKGINAKDGVFQIGALTTIRQLKTVPQIQETYTALAEACASFGSTQIQIMGTIGGNLCNGSPASDTVPALIAFDSKVVLAGPHGERALPIAKLLLGPGKVGLREGEILTTVQVPIAKPNTGSAFLKLSRVRADLAKISIAAVIVRDKQRVIDCRLVYGSVGPTVLRAPEAENVLIGETFNAKLALQAGQVASKVILPIDDSRSSAWYRRQVAVPLTQDALCKAWERAGELRKPKALEISSLFHKVPAPFRVSANGKHSIRILVNGVDHRLDVAPNELLLNVLRERLELTGPKYGCGTGECGACTVWVNGEPVLACLVLAISTDGSEIVTVEGLARSDGKLDPLQQAFIDHNAFQCGYCTPGMLMMSKKLLAEIPSPTEDEIRDYLKGNRCRCTGYASIVRAVESCARGTKEGESDAATI